MKTNIITIAASVMLSIVTTGIVTKQLVNEHAETKREFKVIDIAILTEKLMENLENEIAKSDTELKPEMIEFIAKQEAKKMYTQIALHEGGQHIVLPKRSVIYTPQSHDITQQISTKLGLGEVGKTGLNKLVDDSEANPTSD